MALTDYYFDLNRGSDSNDGSISSPFKNPSKIATLTPANIATINFANDSEWVIEADATLSNFVNITALSNGDTYPIVVSGYGSASTKPKFKYALHPESGDWQWDAVVESWYLDSVTGYFGNGGIGCIIDGSYVPQGGKGVGAYATSAINDYVGSNGVTDATLRWAVPVGQHTFYLKGGGLTGATDPTTYFGAGNITIYPCALFYAWQALANTTVDGLDFEGGGFLLQYGTTADLVRENIVFQNCTGSNVTTFLNVLARNTGASLIDLHVADNTFDHMMSMGVVLTSAAAGGVGQIAADISGNRCSYGNLCWSAGGFIYMQATPPSGSRVLVYDNYAEYMSNGIGTSAFDGCGFYQDINGDGAEFFRNTVAHSYKAYQENSGAAGTWHANIAYDCCKFGTFTDDDEKGVGDYIITHNLLLASANPDTYSHGTDEGAGAFGRCAIGAWCKLGGTFTQTTIRNNLLVAGQGYSDVIGVAAYPSTMWSGSGVSGLNVQNNVLVGDFMRSITPSNDADSDKSAIYDSFITAASSKIVVRNGLAVSIGADSAAFAAGIDASSKETDFYAREYQSPPTCGPFEPRRFGNWLGSVGF